MDFSSLLRVDETAQRVDLVLDVDESSFGYICASLDKVLITPLYKSGRRKGKQSFFDLENGTEVSVKLPRGMSKYKIVESFDQYYWLRDNDRFSQEDGLFVLSPAKLSHSDD